MKSSNKERTHTEALIEALNLNKSTYDKPSEEWATVLDLAKASNRSLSHTSKKVRVGLLNGTIETKTFRVERDGVLRCVPYYRVKVASTSCRAVEVRDSSNKTPKGKRR